MVNNGVKLSRAIVEDYIKEINKHKKGRIKLDRNKETGEYFVFFNNELLNVGTLKESFLLIEGLAYGIGIKVESLFDNKGLTKGDETEGYSLLARKFAFKKALLIEAKKTAVDEYYSQGKLRYTINIEKLENSYVTITAEIKRYSNDDTPIYGSLLIPTYNIGINLTDSVDTTIRKILKYIDMAITRMGKENKDFHFDYILWITDDVMRYLGWVNPEMVTKKVDIKIL